MQCGVNFVMPGLVPASTSWLVKKGVDGGDKPGHDTVYSATRGGRGYIASRSSGRCHCGPRMPCLAPILCRGADSIHAGAHLPRALKADVDGEETRRRALEHDLLRRCHHRQSAFGVAEQVLRRHHDGKVLHARDQIKLRQLAHNFPLSVPAGMKINSAPRSASARVTSGI